MIVQSKTKFVFLSFLINHCAAIFGRKYSRNSQDAWLFPGSTQRGFHLTYSNSADWSDLWKLLSENGFLTSGSLCIKGVFILYEEPLYAVPTPNAFEIVSGNMKCMMISENTKSIQLIGSVGRMYGPSVTFFEKPYFGSEGFTSVINVGSQFFQKMEYTRSAIIVGQISWTLTFTSGKSICVQPEFDPEEQKPICLVRDLKLLLDTLSDDDDESGADLDENFQNASILLRATQGCEKIKDEDSIFRIQDCQYWGRPSNHKDVSITFEDTSKLGGRSDTDKPDALCNGDESAKRIFLLYKAVLTKTFDTQLLVGLDTVGKHAWKLDLLDWMFTIVTDVIPDDIISTAFLNKVRELFVHKLVTVWNKKGEDDTKLLLVTERNYKTLLLLTEKCDTEITIVEDEHVPSVAWSLSDVREFKSMWHGIQKLEDFAELINPEFERQPSLDIITEMVWVIGHITGYICHSQFMSMSHFWALYFNIFWNFYLLPIVPEWGTATQGLNIFFGGVDYNVEYHKLAMFAGVTRKKARNLEPLKRPDEVLPPDEEELREEAELREIASTIYDTLDAELSSVPIAPLVDER